MLNLKEALAADIAEGLAATGLVKTENLSVPVERSGSPEGGDYASPVALALAKQLGKTPMEIVRAIVEHMPKKEYLGRVTVAEPGFINIRLNPGWLTARLDNFIAGDVCDGIDIGQGQSVNLEFISANPTGPLTLGNIRTAFSADTLGNVLSCAGYTVTREYYINDAGGQIKRLGESVVRRILQEQGDEVDYGEELYQGDYIKGVAKRIAETMKENEDKVLAVGDLEDEELLRAVGGRAADIFMVQIKQTISDDLRMSFDVWTSETQLINEGKVDQAVAKLRAKKATYTKDGAEYLRTTKFGDSEDRVLVKADGEYAYIAPDVAYHLDKYAREYDRMMTFVGSDHQGHAPKLRAALTALGKDVSRLEVVTAQWMRVVRDGKPVKMSKRVGQIETPGELIKQAGYDAARFFMVQHALTTHMDFDLDLAHERSERNPVYYVQYAYVRLQSILRQAKERGVIEDIGFAPKLSERPVLTHTLELNLMRELYRLPEVIADIAESFAVHDLTYYALDLAKAVHVYYRHVSVLGAGDEELVKSRLQLVLAARGGLGKTLDLLGLGKPDVM